MPARLEHANLTVPDIDAAIAFLMAMEPAFEIRHDSGNGGPYRWVHIGTEGSYVALEEPHEPNPKPIKAGRYSDYGVNHLGWVVDDVDTVCARLEAAGYSQDYKVEDHRFRKRRYFLDHAGFEWELVEYLSTDPDEQNQYG